MYQLCTANTPNIITTAYLSQRQDSGGQGVHGLGEATLVLHGMAEDEIIGLVVYDDVDSALKSRGHLASGYLMMWLEVSCLYPVDSRLHL